MFQVITLNNYSLVRPGGTHRFSHRRPLAFEQLEFRLPLAILGTLDVNYDYSLELALATERKSLIERAEVQYVLVDDLNTYPTTGDERSRLSEELDYRVEVESPQPDGSSIARFFTTANGYVTFWQTYPLFSNSVSLADWFHMGLYHFDVPPLVPAQARSFTTITLTPHPSSQRSNGDSVVLNIHLDFNGFDGVYCQYDYFAERCRNSVDPTGRFINSQLALTASVSHSSNVVGLVNTPASTWPLNQSDSILRIPATFGSPVVVTVVNDLVGTLTPVVSEDRWSYMQLQFSASIPTGPDLKVMQDDENGGASNLYWNSLEDGGGFTFTYHVKNPNNDLPDTTIDFFWSRAISKSPAYTFVIDDGGVDDKGDPLKAEGQHTIHITHAMLREKGIPSPLGTMDNFSEVSLQMVIDPMNKVEETNELNNELALEYLPLVVNVVSHGFNPIPISAGSWETFRQFWDILGAQLADSPADNSILDRRVASYVPHWESSESFISGIVELFAAYEAVAKSELATSDFLRRKYASLAEIARKWALATAERSDRILLGSALFAVDQLINSGNSLLLPPEESNGLQVIELIGHSRGAALNAWIARILNSLNYHNIKDYVALDGYSSDWSLRTPYAGSLTNIDIDATVGLAADRNVYYLPEVGLASDQFLVDNLSTFLGRAVISPDTLARVQTDTNLMSPERTVVDLTIHGPFEGSPIGHTNIYEAYQANEGLLRDNYLGHNLRAGIPNAANAVTAFAAPSEPTIAAHSVAQSPSIAAAHLPSLTGFADGNIDALGSLFEDVQAADLTPAGDPFIDSQLALLADPMQAIGLWWRVIGEVRLAYPDDSAALELHHAPSGDTSIGQTIVVPPRGQSLEFDLGIRDAVAGDVLDVLLDGAVIQSIDLNTVAAVGHHSLPLAPIPANSVGTFTFRLTGASGSAGTITLDNIAIGVAPNQSPLLATTTVPMPRVSTAITDGTNQGIGIVDLVSGISDENQTLPSQLGIAITGADSNQGTFQFSLDKGRTWRNIGEVSDANALLLAIEPGTRIRFSPDPSFTGAATDQLQFRAWDQTTDLMGITGDYFNASANGGQSPFSSTTAALSAHVSLYAWHNSVQPFDVSGDGSLPDGAVVAGDALTIINYINAFGAIELPTIAPFDAPFIDTEGGPNGDGDGFVSPGDALAVINYINGHPEPSPEKEPIATPVSTSNDDPNNGSEQNGSRQLSDLVALLALDIASQPKRRR